MNSAVSYHSSQMSLDTVHRCAVQLESVKVVGNVTYRMAGNNSLHNKTSLCASYINNIVIIFCYVVFIHFLEFLVLGIFWQEFLRTEFSEENLVFWEKCEDYRNLNDVNQVGSQVVFIFCQLMLVLAEEFV